MEKIKNCAKERDFLRQSSWDDLAVYVLAHRPEAENELVFLERVYVFLFGSIPRLGGRKLLSYYRRIVYRKRVAAVEALYQAYLLKYGLTEETQCLLTEDLLYSPYCPTVLEICNFYSQKRGLCSQALENMRQWELLGYLQSNG